jgi:hypothetical protein
MNEETSNALDAFARSVGIFCEAVAVQTNSKDLHDMSKRIQNRADDLRDALENEID